MLNVIDKYEMNMNMKELLKIQKQKNKGFFFESEVRSLVDDMNNRSEVISKENEHHFQE